MSEPRKIITCDQRTHAGDLRAADWWLIKTILSDWGYVLLPSDTCYAMATYAALDSCEKTLNTILSRSPDSISLCASDFQDALRWIDNENHTAVSLLAYLTPGPITVVCEASELLGRKSRFFQNTLAAKQGEIGIRISDSLVERQVSGTSDDFLISSTAVRNLQTGEPITDFGEAFEIVKHGIKSLDGVVWCAIEGKNFLGVHSTVVRAFRDGTFEIKRSGALSHEEIEQAARTTPPTLLGYVSKSRVDQLADHLLKSALLEVDPEEVKEVVLRYSNGEILEKEAIDELRFLHDKLSGHLMVIDRSDVGHEWKQLSLELRRSEEQYGKKAQQQYLFGFLSLPIAVLVIFLSLFLGWQSTEGATVIAGLAGTALLSLAAHAFYGLRVYQQASSAAERLSEKRGALLFLKLALGSSEEDRKTLEKATTMFFGHHAPETLPLSPQDSKAQERNEER